MVNKTLGLLATIVGALYGGILMQRLSLFRALLIFGILQGASNAGYWLLSITDKNMFSMGAAVFSKISAVGWAPPPLSPY